MSLSQNSLCLALTLLSSVVSCSRKISLSLSLSLSLSFLHGHLFPDSVRFVVSSAQKPSVTACYSIHEAQKLISNLASTFMGLRFNGNTSTDSERVREYMAERPRGQRLHVYVRDCDEAAAL